MSEPLTNSEAWLAFFNAEPCNIVLVYIPTGSGNAPSNYSHGQLLKLAAQAIFESRDIAGFPLPAHEGCFVFLQSERVNSILPALQKLISINCLPPRTELAWWDAGECVVRDFHAPLNLPFARHIDEIIWWHTCLAELPGFKS